MVCKQQATGGAGSSRQGVPRADVACCARCAPLSPGVPGLHCLSILPRGSAARQRRPLGPRLRLVPRMLRPLPRSLISCDGRPARCTTPPGFVLALFPPLPSTVRLCPRLSPLPTVSNTGLENNQRGRGKGALGKIQGACGAGRGAGAGAGCVCATWGLRCMHRAGPKTGQFSSRAVGGIARPRRTCLPAAGGCWGFAQERLRSGEKSNRQASRSRLPAER